MKVELIDLKQRFKDEEKTIMKIVHRVLSKGNLILTKEVQNFEKMICKYTNTKYCLGLNSGTDALMMSLWSSGIKKGDEVITSPISFVATANAIVHVGAKPVFVDVGDDLNINPELIENAITKKTKAIIPVHWTGRVCKMDKIMKIAKKYGLIVIEDAAQATGAYYKNKHAGTFGKISAFSTHPLKNLNALGDGGFIITNEKKLYDKIKLYRSHGLEGRDDAKIIGVNSRLDSLNAEVLTFRLKKLREIIKKRKKNISLYRKYIKTDKVQILDDNKKETNSYVMFITLSKKREKLQIYLKKHKIQSLLYYPTPLHMHKSMKFLKYGKGSLPNAERITEEVISFPHHQYISEKQIKYVCNKINNFYGKK
tara:strand:+ start:2392 stop:3495 length:1104 start_codon:yes stop_codon:yes gene_type:complete